MSIAQKPAKEAPLPPAPRFDKPIAPPPVPIKSEDQQQQKKTRSRSMIVPKTKNQPNAVGQTPGGPLIPFDPLKAFSAASQIASGSFPRSELQLPETSTLLHPSKFAQIIMGSHDGEDVGIQIKTKRSHTIAGDAKTIKVPSGYRETLLKRRQEGNAHPSGPSLSSLITQPNLPGPTPSPPKVSKSHAKKSSADSGDLTAKPGDAAESAATTEGEANTGSSSDTGASASADEKVETAEASGSSSSSSGEGTGEGEEGGEEGGGEGGEELPYGLKYNENLIDFVDHPADEVDDEGEGEGAGAGEGEGDEKSKEEEGDK